MYRKKFKINFFLFKEVNGMIYKVDFYQRLFGFSG